MVGEEGGVGTVVCAIEVRAREIIFWIYGGRRATFSPFVFRREREKKIIYLKANGGGE